MKPWQGAESASNLGLILESQANKIKTRFRNHLALRGHLPEQPSGEVAHGKLAFQPSPSLLLSRRIRGGDSFGHRLCGGCEIRPVTSGLAPTKGVLILLYTRGVGAHGRDQNAR